MNVKSDEFQYLLKPADSLSVNGRFPDSKLLRLRSDIMKKTQTAKPTLKNVSLKWTKIVYGSAQTPTQLGIFTPFQIRFCGREALRGDRLMGESNSTISMAHHSGDSILPAGLDQCLHEIMYSFQQLAGYARKKSILYITGNTTCAIYTLRLLSTITTNVGWVTGDHQELMQNLRTRRDARSPTSPPRTTFDGTYCTRDGTVRSSLSLGLSSQLRHATDSTVLLVPQFSSNISINSSPRAFQYRHWSFLP